MQPNRNLVIARVGDASLHGCWLDRAAGARNWDLHLSYFGKAGAPVPCEGDNITWSRNPEPSKWTGVYAVLDSGVVSLDRYDYVFFGDDDLILRAGDLSRAFDVMREYDLAAAQLSLHQDSYFGLPLTLRHPLLKLHYVTRIELMAPILRTDVVRLATPYMRDPDNIWGMDHVVARLASQRPRAIAVLDEFSALHTRAFWTSAMYARERARTGRDPLDVERGFLERHDIPYVEARFLGGLTRSGGQLGPRWGWISSALVRARLLRKWRKTMRPDLLRIASVDKGQVVVMRPMPGAEGLRVDYEVATGLKCA